MNYTIEKLPNGCTILYHYRNSSLSYLGVAFNVGSRDENQNDKFGIAHLLEHSVFLGSTRYSNIDFEIYSKEICCDFDAMTSKEVTLFNMAVLDQYVVDGIDLLLNTTLFPTFPDILFKQEKQVVKNEIDRHNSSISSIIYDNIMATLYENHPLAHPILGDCNAIDKITINDVIQFHKQYYSPNNMTFFYSGNVKYKHIKNLLVEKIKKGTILPPKRIPIRPYHICTPFKPVDKKATDIIEVAIFGYAPEEHHGRYMVFQLLKEILSSNMGNGVLLRQLRNRCGLVYSIEMGYASFSDTAFWNIRYKCRAIEATNIYNIILNILSNIQLYINDSKDIDYYKRCLLINLLRQEDDWKKCLISDVLSIYSKNEYSDLSRFTGLINNITIDDIISESEQTFSAQNIYYREYIT